MGALANSRIWKVTVYDSINQVEANLARFFTWVLKNKNAYMKRKERIC